jgi:uncharacterized membrane protein
LFSVALNLAVATTVAWRVWWNPARPKFPTEGYQALSPGDFAEIRRLGKACGPNLTRESRLRVREKRNQIIDILAHDPQNLEAVEQPLSELVSLHHEADRRAVKRLSAIMAALSPEKRESFASFLKLRPFAGKGMGMGMGKKGIGLDGLGPRHGPPECPPPR